MLSIFQKKNFLVDLLEGFTDFHNHILPGIDDGASTLDDSVALIRKFKEIGIKDFVATPHVMGDYYPNNQNTIGKALDLVKNAEVTDISIKAAAEYMMDQHLVDTLQSEDLLSVAQNYVLVEMSYFQAPINLYEILFKLQNKSYSPILAHPERYAFYHGSGLTQYKDLKNRGCSFQMNILSLTPHYGIGIQKTANKLLESGMIDFISSDAHRLQHLEKLLSIRISKKQLKLLEPVLENSKNLF